MIEVTNLYKKFGRHDALKGLNLNVPDGSCFALIGSNGAGKTTTIQILMNILEPTAGSATILGVDSRKMSPRELAQIGYVSENQKFPGRLTVRQYMDYLRPFYPAWDVALEASTLRELRLPVDRKIGQLSHGMRMKLCLACALPFRPKVLILDEPFSGVDPLVRDEFMERLLGQAGEMTVLISSHELSEIEGMATHVAYLEEGRVQFQESMAELTSRFREVRVTLEQEASAPSNVPSDWMNVRTSGNVVTFVDARFVEQNLTAKIGAAFEGVRRVDVEPVGLRSMFTTLARESRRGGE